MRRPPAIKEKEPTSEPPLVDHQERKQSYNLLMDPRPYPTLFFVCACVTVNVSVLALLRRVDIDVIILNWFVTSPNIVVVALRATLQSEIRWCIDGDHRPCSSSNGNDNKMLQNKKISDAAVSFSL